MFLSIIISEWIKDFKGLHYTAKTFAKCLTWNTNYLVIILLRWTGNDEYHFEIFKGQECLETKSMIVYIND